MVGFSESNEFVRKTGTTPPRPSASFGDGTRKVAAITWRNTSNADGCYWERLRGFSGNLDDIIANNISTDSGRSLVTVAASDAGFTSRRCGTWVPDIGPITLAPNVPFGDGAFRVGRDVAPGTWQASSPTDSCYWERLSGFSGTLDDVLANNIGPGPMMVTISPSDVGFDSHRCGTWTKVS